MCFSYGNWRSWKITRLQEQFVNKKFWYHLRSTILTSRQLQCNNNNNNNNNNDLPLEAAQDVDAVVVAPDEVEADDSGEDDKDGAHVEEYQDAGLHGEGAQGRDGDDGSREESQHVCQRRQQHRHAGPLQHLARQLLPQQPQGVWDNRHGWLGK